MPYRALNILTAENVVAWFRHCGYWDTPTPEPLVEQSEVKESAISGDDWVAEETA